MMLKSKEKSKQMFGWLKEKFNQIIISLIKLNSNLTFIENNYFLRRFFSFLGMTRFGSRAYQCGFYLGLPELDRLFLIQWNREVKIFIPTGNVITKGNFKLNETATATEHYSLNLWNPFVINSWYKARANDQRVVVEYDGFEEIETHEFEYFVERKKRLWWKSFRVVNRNLSNSTEFDRMLDDYLTRGY